MSDVSHQQTSKETDQQPYMESELNAPFPITDASEQTMKVQFESNLVDSKINDTIEHANKITQNFNDTCTAQVTSGNDKDYSHRSVTELAGLTNFLLPVPLPPRVIKTS